MSRDRIQRLVESMDPLEAAQELAVAAKKLFSLLGEEAPAACRRDRRTDS